MNKGIWEAIATINELLLPLRESGSGAALVADDLVKLRVKLRGRLDYLRVVTTERHSERDAYFVLFPLTAHCDELVKTLILDMSQLQWPPLQQELYQIADAGDLFFETLDNLLGRPETLPLVYEVYYFCLRDGFRGRHIGNPDKIEDYCRRLRERIPLPKEVLSSERPSTGERHLAPWRVPVFAYYLATVSVLILSYLFLKALASSWQPVG